ncbi:MAG: hypothetical protein IT557_11680 [Alphaproteobacteria bacterium]|nr:hypothetical protein [Alphaproteobacteria bacterium]
MALCRLARRAGAPVLTVLLPLVVGACANGGLFGPERGSGERVEIAPGPSETRGGGSAVGRTGTVVGARVSQLRADLSSLQGQVRAQVAERQQIRAAATANAARYQANIAQINSRLQVGTTPGNPELVEQWNQAQRDLSLIEDDTRRLNALSARVAQSSSFAGFVLESARAAYGLSGAVEQDHRDLATIEDETNRTLVEVDRLLNELSEDVNRQTASVASERRNLSALSVAIQSGQIFGMSLANRASLAPLAAGGARASGQPRALGRTSRGAVTGTSRPLVVIRFDGGRTPDYQQPLYDAVARALERRPGATFDIVAVSPSEGRPADLARGANQSRRNAEGVLRTLVEMGMPSERVGLSGAQSRATQGSEVHVYVR